MPVEEQLAELLADLPTNDAGSLKANLLALVSALEAGQIDEPTFERQFRAELASAYLNTYASALPPTAEFTPDDLSAIRDLLDTQAPNIASFGHDIASGGGTMPHVERVDMYDASTWAAEQAAVVAILLISQQEVSWVLDPSGGDHCGPCVTATDHGPYASVLDLPGLPGTEYCDGWVRCRCYIIPTSDL